MATQRPQNEADETAEQDYEERIASLEAALATSRATAARAPLLVVPEHGGGPGYDNHRPSWSQAEQEIARSGDWLDTWGDNPNA